MIINETIFTHDEVYGKREDDKTTLYVLLCTTNVTNHMQSFTVKPGPVYHPCMRVCPSVCNSLTSESLGLESSFAGRSRPISRSPNQGQDHRINKACLRGWSAFDSKAIIVNFRSELSVFR